MKPPNEVIHELVKQWLGKAEEDLEVAEYLLSRQTPYLGVIAFHAQQAAEKYLKAYLVHHQIEFPKTHHLGELLDLVARANPSLAAELRDITVLNPYGVEVRYPGDSPLISPQEAQVAVSLAQKVQQSILPRL